MEDSCWPPACPSARRLERSVPVLLSLSTSPNAPGWPGWLQLRQGDGFRIEVAFSSFLAGIQHQGSFRTTEERGKRALEQAALTILSV